MTICICVASMPWPSIGVRSAQTSMRILRVALVRLAILTRLLTALDCGTQYSVVTSMFLRVRAVEDEKIWIEAPNRRR